MKPLSIIPAACYRSRPTVLCAYPVSIHISSPSLFPLHTSTPIQASKRFFMMQDHRQEAKRRGQSAARSAGLAPQRSGGSTRSIGSSRSNASTRSNTSTGSPRSKPTVLLIPGAWLSPACYSSFVAALQKAGYPTQVCHYLSLDPVDPFTASCAADAEWIRKNMLVPLIEKDKRDVVMIMHSYGGMPGAAAARGYSKPQCFKRGRAGGVVGLIFVSAFLISEGASCAESMGGQLPPWILQDRPQPGLNMPKDPIAMFCSGIARSLVYDIPNKLMPHSTLAFKSAQPPPAWADPAFKGRLAFVITTEDQAVPKAAQEGMIAGTGQKWIIQEVAGSHNAPFLDQRHTMVKMVEALLKRFNEA